MGRVYSLKAVQQINTNLEPAWNFFSRAENLAAITPSTLEFKISGTDHNTPIYAGQIIEYTLKPLLGIPVYWMTEITQVCQHQYFIDEQRFGPYSFWHHQHHFKTINNVVEMTDLVHYKIPYWFIGDMANALIVRKKLKEIFEFRYKRIAEIFPGSQNEKSDIVFR